MILKRKKVPLRMCLGCQEMKPKKELIRIVRNKEGETFMDLTGKKAGRGAYICRSTQCLDRAKKGKRLEKAFEARIDDTVYDILKSELEGSDG
jgi:predicted RNA-binding protein YlxR (DUF448 family)